jgi:hypothetical protein
VHQLVNKKLWRIFLFQLNAPNILSFQSTKTHTNIYSMDHTGPAWSLLNTVQIRTTFHIYPRHAPQWHGPPERGSFYRRALSRAPRPRACPHMLRVHNAALLTVCSNKLIVIEWHIFPFKLSLSWRLERRRALSVFHLKWSCRHRSILSVDISEFCVLASVPIN